ncbi:MAG: pyrroline-5-carboxylate reductase [Gammaproteobacteria bacterium]
MKQGTIALIGCGNMGRCLLGGLIADGYPIQRLRVSDVSADQLRLFTCRFPVSTSTDNARIVEGADVVVLAVKPQVMKTVATALAAAIGRQRPLVISIAAGITTLSLSQWLGPELAIVRAMPNTPALVGSGATALFANKFVQQQQREIAELVLRTVGLTVWLDKETLMDAVTAVSGSGPAYFFLLMQLVERSAIGMGLPHDLARLLTLQTAFGAAKMALESSADTATLCDQVASPGGTTEQAIRVLRDAGLSDIVDQALKAAQRRSQELAKLFGES